MTLSRLLNWSASWPNTVVREFRRPLPSRTNRVSTASSMFRCSVRRQAGWPNQHIDRLISKTAFHIEFHENTRSHQLPNIILNVCGCMCVFVPGSLASIDSASSQTISSLLLAPCWAEERGLTSSMVFIRLMVSWRWGGKHITHTHPEYACK